MLNTVEGAVLLATRAHDGQVDKQGIPYILHPLRVGASLWEFGVDYVIAGILHDVVEDTPHTLDDLTTLGATPEVVSAVAAVTRVDKWQPYVEFLAQATADPIGGWVKASDVCDNLKRISGIPDRETRKRLLRKYSEAEEILAEQGFSVNKFW